MLCNSNQALTPMRKRKIPINYAVKEAPLITSENIEPVCQYLMGRWYAKCEIARQKNDMNALESACENWWIGMCGLRKVAVACTTSDGEAAHFSMALSSETIKVADYIEAVLGIDPMKEWKR